MTDKKLDLQHTLEAMGQAKTMLSERILVSGGDFEQILRESGNRDEIYIGVEAVFLVPEQQVVVASEANLEQAITELNSLFLEYRDRTEGTYREGSFTLGPEGRFVAPELRFDIASMYKDNSEQGTVARGLRLPAEDILLKINVHLVGVPNQALSVYLENNTRAALQYVAGNLTNQQVLDFAPADHRHE